MMKNNRTVIQCCNNTHQRAPFFSKQMCAFTSDRGDGSHVACTAPKSQFVWLNLPHSLTLPPPVTAKHPVFKFLEFSLSKG